MAVDWRNYNSGGKFRCGAPGEHLKQDKTRKEHCGGDQHPVQGLHGIKMEATSFCSAVASGPHGIASDHTALQCPGSQGGQDRHAVRDHVLLAALFP